MTTLTDVWAKVDDFVKDYDSYFAMLVYDESAGTYSAGGLFAQAGADTILGNFWNILKGRHGADEVLYDDNIGDGLERWKLRFCAIMNNHGPEFFEKIKLQARIRAMTDKELMDSGLDVNTVAYNPAQAPTDTFKDTDIGEVDTINSQTARRGKRSLADAVLLRERLLSFDYWEDFVRLFDPLFKKVLASPWREGELEEVDE